MYFTNTCDLVWWWIFEFAQDLVDVANFAIYFSASPAALSTLHLYISSLATWPNNSTALEDWYKQVYLIPLFRQTKGKDSHTVPFMTIMMDSYVNCVAFSGNSSHIVSGLDDKPVWVWDALDGVELKMLNGHTDNVWSVAFSSDGTHNVSSHDKSVWVWDALSGVELKVLNGHSGSVWSC